MTVYVLLYTIDPCGEGRFYIYGIYDRYNMAIKAGKNLQKAETKKIV